MHTVNIFYSANRTVIKLSNLQIGHVRYCNIAAGKVCDLLGSSILLLFASMVTWIRAI